MENIKPLKNANAGFYYFFASMDMKFNMDIKMHTAFTMVVKYIIHGPRYSTPLQS